MAPSGGSSLVPALVVMDSRNMLHQSEKVLGRQLHPTVDGVVRALRPYGFEALEVHVGLALPRKVDALALKYVDDVNRPYKMTIEAHPRGKVLLGEVHDKRDGPEEKMVDVHCAVDIARTVALIADGNSPFKAIVVLSQDIDLTPAYDYAASAGVPLYVGSADVIQHRPQDHLLLGEFAFRLMCSPNVLSGQSLRAAIARTLDRPTTSDWIAGRYTRSRKGVFVEHSASGVIGVCHSSYNGQWVEGTPYQLHPVGLNWGSQRDFPFPAVNCSPAVGPMQARLERAVVTRRRTPLAVEVEMSDGTRKQVSSPIGYLVPGMAVLIEVEPKGNIRYIGALDPCEVPGDPVLTDYIKRGVPFVSRVLAVQSPQFALGTGPIKGMRVGVVTLPRTPVSVGARVACVIVDKTRKGPTAQIVSSVLP